MSRHCFTVWWGQSQYDLRTSSTREEQVGQSMISHLTRIWDVMKAFWNFLQLYCLEKHVVKGLKFYPYKTKLEARKCFKQGNDNIRFGI